MFRGVRSTKHRYEFEAGYQSLKIWRKGMAIAKEIYEATAHFPKEEKYGLVSQMRRCAVSIPSNIAEGYSRKNNKEFKQFLYIALGSLSELETQVVLSEQIGLMSESEILRNMFQHERAMILKMCHRS